MSSKTEEQASHKELGTWRCLDFANTVSNYEADDIGDKLESYADLVSWAQEEKILSAEDGRRLLERAAGKPTEAEAVLADAKRLRKTIYGIFSDIAHDRSPSEKDMATLNAKLNKVLPHQQLVERGGEFVWDWRDRAADLDRPLWPVIRCASNLLTSEELGRVSECNGNCTWLFIDRSKNASRRWCDMGTCGNRAKSRRHYARTQQVAAAEG
ncbi:MAG: ABATE domain-containing protein [Fidelibacterota bacterium]|nr:MAG: ABATE domain-containing protein [Candidatus Neomarinimicrobiota bacterium]